MQLERICLWKEVVEEHDSLDETQYLFELMKKSYDCHQCDGKNVDCSTYAEIYKRK